MTAFNKYRVTAAGNLEYLARQLKVSDIIEPLMPAFVGNRYRIESIYEDTGYDATPGRYAIVLNPDLDKAPKGKSDSLHADVTKLFAYLMSKRVSNGNGDVVIEPVRQVQAWGEGAIRYRMVVSHIPDLNGRHLEVNFQGLPAGTKCEVIKTPKGEPRLVQDYTYELKCEE